MRWSRPCEERNKEKENERSVDERQWRDGSARLNISVCVCVVEGWEVTAVKGALPMLLPLLPVLLSPINRVNNVGSPCKQGSVARERGSEGRARVAVGDDNTSLAAFNSSSKE